MDDYHDAAMASLRKLQSIFTTPESADSTLARIDREIASNLTGFLQDNIVATPDSLAEIEQAFSDPAIPEQPLLVSQQTDFLMEKVVAQSVHTASPRFVGHMTSALPYFTLSLSRIVVALNQNLVKTETAKAFTPLERQVLGMLHHLVYQRDDAFYRHNMHASRRALGSFCSGGTVANITALWVARNRAFAADGNFRGVGNEGLHRALNHYGYSGVAILVSRLGHYSLGKAADVLGIGRDSIVQIETDTANRIDIAAAKKAAARLRRDGVKLLAVIGVAGTTETGSVDPLPALADLAAECGAHFHVDAAWGGPTLLSDKHSSMLKGIERADSVTLDAHKQLYVPMGAGMVVFKEPEALTAIEHHARYIIRPGSRDLGATTLEGSRPGMALLVHSSLRILGRRGYAMLVDQGIEKARAMAKMIERDPDFELTTAPELNILTYRFVPAPVQKTLSGSALQRAEKINDALNQTTRLIQVTQRQAGHSFVSRTQVRVARHGHQPLVVFRVVLANPLTTLDILAEILAEQKAIAAQPAVQQLLGKLQAR